MIEVPALRGDDPLGFLAALGVVALAETGDIPPIRLAWSSEASPIARFSGNLASVTELGDALEQAFSSLRDRGLPGPGLLTDFPEGAKGGKDPMRRPPEEVRAWFKQAHEEYLDGNPWLARWLVAITAQTDLKHEKRGDVRLTPFYAPTGQMKLRNALFDATADAVASVEGPSDAVTRWRRSKFDGANFDGRATRDSAVTTTGKARNEGAPSATWLAVMAMRFFQMIDPGRGANTTGWQAVRMYEGYTARSLVWPCWQEPVSAPGIRTVMNHPALQLETDAIGQPRIGRTAGRELAGLGVAAVFGSSRRTLSQGDGPLGPAHRVWVKGA